MEEKILLDIEFNTPEIAQAIKNIVDSRKKIDELKEANKQLADQGKKNSAAYVQNEASIKGLNQTVSENSRIVQANTQANKVNADSIEALRKENSELIKERNKLSTSTDEGRKRIDEINDKLDQNNAKIKDNSSALEQQKINIGNYSSALDNVIPGLGSFATGLQGASSSGGGLIGTIQGITKASLAFIATPIGAIIAALVVAFTALKTFVTGSTEGMDKFEQVADAASAVVGVLVDRVVSLVSSLGKLLSGDFSGALDGIKESFTGIGDEIAREVGLAVELRKAIQDLEDAEVNYEIASSKTENTIKRLLLQSKNRKLDEQERIKLQQEALDLENQQTAELIKNKEEALRISNDQAVMINEVAKALEESGGAIRKAGESETEFGQRIIDTGKVLDDQRDAIKDNIIALNQAVGQSLAFQEKVQNMQDALYEKQEAEALKRAEKEKALREKREAEILKAAETERQALFDLNVFRLEQDIIATKSIEDKAAKQIELEKYKTDFLLENDKLTTSEQLLIAEEYAAAVLAIETKKQADIDILRKENAEKTRANRAEDLEMLTRDAQTELDIEVNKLKEQVLAGTLSKEEYDQQILDAELAMLQAQADIKAVFGEQDIALATSITDKKLQIKQYEVNRDKQLEQAKFQAVQGILSQAATLLNKNTLAYKALAIAQATINTYQAASNALAQYPYPFGAIAAALAVVQGLVQVANIANTQVPKMEHGGVINIGGKRHSSGGEDVHIGGQKVANVEAGERMVVLKRGANSQLLNSLGAINAMAGGVNFAQDRSPKRYLADGGFVARSTSRSVDRITNRNLTESLREGLTGVKLQVGVTDINRAQENEVRADVISELR